jgi:anti-sigma B factor antagonist
MTDDVAGFGVRVNDTPMGPVVMPHGDIDMGTADELERIARPLASSGQALLTIDMSGVDFCDSAGINALVRIKKACDAAGGRFAVSSPQAHVRHVLAVSGLIEFLNVKPSAVKPSGDAGSAGADGQLHH